MNSRYWYVRWKCPKCGQVFIIPIFDADRTTPYVCSWCGAEVSIDASYDGIFEGEGGMVERFPRLDITTVRQRPAT